MARFGFDEVRHPGINGGLDFDDNRLWSSFKGHDRNNKTQRLQEGIPELDLQTWTIPSFVQLGLYLRLHFSA